VQGVLLQARGEPDGGQTGGEGRRTNSRSGHRAARRIAEHVWEPGDRLPSRAQIGHEFLADGRPLQLSTSWEPYDLTVGTLVVLPEGGPHAGVGVVNRMAAIGITVSHAVEQPEPRRATAEEASLLGIQRSALVTRIQRTYCSDEGRPVETADIVVPAAHCEIVYEIPINRWQDSSGARS
jgi:DNA-binding GntR family transcriptional regulator